MLHSTLAGLAYDPMAADAWGKLGLFLLGGATTTEAAIEQRWRDVRTLLECGEFHTSVAIAGSSD